MSDVVPFLSWPPSAASLWEVQRHFIEGNLDMALVKEAIILIGIIVGVLSLVMLAIHFRPKKPYIPQDWVIDPKEIRETINEALAQRSKFELQFTMEGETRRPSVRCNGIDLKDDQIILEAGGLSSMSSRWKINLWIASSLSAEKDNIFFTRSRVLSAR